MSGNRNNKRPGRSTGPLSENGKENSSRNAATHGLSCEKCFLIHGETEEEFNAHAQTWFNEYKDRDSPLLKPLLKDVVEAHWLYRRACKRLYESENALANAEMNRESPEIADEIFKRLQLIQRYKTNYENSYQKALRAIEAFRKTRNAETIGHARLQHTRFSSVAQVAKAYDRMMARGFTYAEATEKLQASYDYLSRATYQAPGNPEPNKTSSLQNPESEPQA